MRAQRQVDCCNDFWLHCKSLKWLQNVLSWLLIFFCRSAGESLKTRASFMKRYFIIQERKPSMTPLASWLTTKLCSSHLTELSAPVEKEKALAGEIQASHYLRFLSSFTKSSFTGLGMFVKVGDAWTLKGITAAGLVTIDGGCNAEAFTLFTDVYKFYDWVKEVIAPVVLYS